MKLKKDFWDCITLNKRRSDDMRIAEPNKREAQHLGFVKYEEYQRKSAIKFSTSSGNAVEHNALANHENKERVLRPYYTK